MTLEQILQQGGLLSVCGMLVFLLREQGKRLAENNSTWVQLGQIVERLTGSVERIEQRLDKAAICPVSGATMTVLQRAAEDAGGPARRQTDAIMHEQLRRAVARLDDQPAHDGR